MFRATLFIAFMATTVGGALWLLDAERTLAAERQALEAFDREAQALLLAVADTRAAQQAYVAEGQGGTFWIARVAETLRAAEGHLGRLRETATLATARTGLDAAAGKLDSFARMDAIASEQARGGERLLASDLIFADGLELTRAAAHEIESVRWQQADARRTAIARLRRQEGWMLGSAALLSLAVMAMMLPWRSVERRARASAAGPPSLSAARQSAPGEHAGPAGAAPQTFADPTPDLLVAAQLCTDFGRVNRTDDLQDLLARTAEVLGASGIVVWMADSGGTHLDPVLSHGYSPQVVARLGRLPSSAQNATAAAYRTGTLQTVLASDTTMGAVVAPIITSRGCVGVMAAEVRRADAAGSAVPALAAIVAAQIAAIVGGPPASEAGKDAASR